MEFSIVNSLNEREIEQLLALYGNEFWSDKRERDEVCLMLKNTDIVIGVKAAAGDLVGFVRVLTDYVFKATIYDLIVHPERRGKAIGRLLMDSVINHRELLRVEHFDLHCLPKMHPFYEKWGFTAELGGVGIMRKHKRK
jgi:GNAT superfamily N-acetyltransferase